MLQKSWRRFATAPSYLLWIEAFDMRFLHRYGLHSSNVDPWLVNLGRDCQLILVSDRAEGVKDGQGHVL